MQSRFNIRLHSLLKRFHCFGISESRLDTLLRPLPLPVGISLGFRAHAPLLEVKVMGIDEDAASLRGRMESVTRAARATLGDYLVVEDDSSIAAAIQEKMISGGHTISLAESCTGGMITAWLVDIAGSSAYVERGFVTYSNRAKIEMLGVPEALIQAHGAVSMEVAREMALGAVRTAGTSHALSVSGVAGPQGGSPQKPVGTVALALAAPDGVFTQMIFLPQWGRGMIRKLAAMAALDMLRRYLTGLPVFGSYDLVRTLQSDGPTRDGVA
jgi:nicotinamide-nucleotide amidase